MKKRILFSCMLFLFCGHLFSQGHGVSKTCKGVLINGVCWAECNVDSPGTFAATPEAYGMYYQWNRKKGWPTTGYTVTGWDSSTPSGDSWEAANDPCPAGWRVPTTEEMATLTDDTKVIYTWTSQNGVNGEEFRDKSTNNAIFFPAAQLRNFADGRLSNSLGSTGLYWSGSSVSSGNVWSLIFLSNSPCGQISFPGSMGFPVRCVANSNVPDCDSIVKNISEIICAGDLPYTWGDTVFQAGTKTGKYRFQRISKVTGCDSIVYLNLTVRPEPHLSFSDAVCSGSRYTGNGFDLPVVFADTLVCDTLQSIWGCDSIRSLYLTVYPSYDTLLYDTIYRGDSYYKHGFSLSDVESGGLYHLPLLSRAGCDSILSLHLSVKEHSDPKPCKGVLINGVCWAECNVDSPGTFAATPEAYGMYYQWNRKKGWPNTVHTVTGWDSSLPSGDSWEVANDPCPAGWRVPTMEEIATLLDDTKVTYVWTSQNGINGGKYTDKLTSNAIFLPATNLRSNTNGELASGGNMYWSGSSARDNYAWSLAQPGVNVTGQIPFLKNFGLSVRCVSNPDFTGCDSIVKNISETICAGDLPYTWGDTVFQAGTQTGKYRFQRISKVTGCDSIVYLNLTVRPEPHLSFSDAVCSGSRYTGNGFDLPVVLADTLVSDTLQTIGGCDSIRILYLTVNPVYHTPLYDTICQGDSYYKHGFSLTNVQSDGSHTLSLLSQTGCDSILSLYLSVKEHSDPKPCKGVLINGVCWAESNVDSPGTFAATPEAYGMLYQWNRKKGWPATGTVSGWDNSLPPGEIWEAANDPCPAGWRIPTIEEIAALLDNMKVTSVWTSQNGIYGRKVTDKATGNSIFLPGVNYRSGNDERSNPNFYGWYWSGNSSNDPISAWILYFINTSYINQVNFLKIYGLSVRCVADPDFTGWTVL